MRPLLLALALAVALLWPSPAGAASPRRQRVVYNAGTGQEVEAYKIHGEKPGPTVMIMGGIQGDEPGGFLSADGYADARLAKGNLIVVPRANFKSIILRQRGPDGDMNRKFAPGLDPSDPDAAKVAALKALMAESDVLLNLHDGSGFYRETWESEAANPGRYGQCVIADAETYTDPRTGRELPLGNLARFVAAKVNEAIADERHKFRFFNTDTGAPDSRHKEQRGSATYYALTQLGLPAFGIETSKNLPDLAMKVRQHNLAVNAFLELFGVEVESPGDVVEVREVVANYGRGLSADALGQGGFNDLGRPWRAGGPAAIEFRKDGETFARVALAMLPPGQAGPALTGGAPAPSPEPAGEPQTMAGAVSRPQNGVTGFILEVDGRRVEVPVGQELAVVAGSKVKMVDIAGDATLPAGAVMNLRGFVPAAKTGPNDGEDRGATADTAKDMRRAFSRGGQGQVYDLNAELGKDVLASASLKIVAPRLAEVTVSFGGQRHRLRLGSRTHIPAGTAVTVEAVTLADGLALRRPRFTLGGQEFPASLPQTLTMPGFAANLAVFDGPALAGKVLWTPLGK